MIYTKAYQSMSHCISMLISCSIPIRFVSSIVPESVVLTHFKSQLQKVKSTQTECMSRQTSTDILGMQTMP